MMKKIFIPILTTLIFVAVSNGAKAQTCTIHTTDSSYNTTISAATNTQIITLAKAFDIEEVLEVDIGKFDQKYTKVYSKLEHHTKLKIAGEYTCKYIESIPLNDHGQFALSQRITLNGNKAELYQAAKQFFTDIFVADNRSLKSDQKEEGEFMIGAVQYISPVNEAAMLYTFKVVTRDGSYDYEIANIEYRDVATDKSLYPNDLFTIENYFSNDGTAHSLNEAYKLATFSVFDPLIIGFKEYMSKSIPELAYSGK